jgi:hypothetical protein
VKTLVLAAMLLAADQTIPIERTKSAECQPQPMNKTVWWSWRLIDGRKCWFPGKKIDKKFLYWKVRYHERISDPDRDTIAERTKFDDRGKTQERTTIQDRANALEGTLFNERWRNLMIDLALIWWRNRQPVQDWRIWQ